MSDPTLMFKFVLSHISTTFPNHFDDTRGSWVPGEQLRAVQFADGPHGGKMRICLIIPGLALRMPSEDLAHGRLL